MDKKLLTKSTIVLFFFLLSSGCFSEFKKIKENVSRIEIYYLDYFDHPKLETTLLYKTDDKIMIGEITSIFTSSNSPYYKCGYNGKILFHFREGDSLEVLFNNSCGHYVMNIKNHSYVKKLNKNNKCFIDSLFNEYLRKVGPL
jgi:hypothetical protein